jgi:hypothetical protein
VNWFPFRPSSKDVGGRSGIFLRRYTLLKSRWFAVYLHRFFRGDADQCLHDHPWWFISIVLCGGYWEAMPDGRHWRRPGSILWRPARTAHRIDLEPGKRTTWSLVITGRKSRDWGFYEPGGWVKWQPDYSPICEEADHVR